MQAQNLGSLQPVDEVWKVLTNKDYYNNNKAHFGLEGLTVVEVLKDNMPKNNLVACPDTQFERLTLMFHASARPEVEKVLFVKSRKLQPQSSAPKQDNLGLLDYECSHYQFWNAAKLPAPTCYAGLRSNGFGAILLDNEGEFNLAHHILALWQASENNNESITAEQQLPPKTNITSSDVNRLNKQLEGLVSAASTTIIEFAVRGSSFFQQAPLTDRPPIYTKDRDYFIQRAHNYINELVKDRGDKQRKEAFSLLESLTESLLQPLVKPSYKVYAQGDEFPHNMVAKSKNGNITVKMLDAASASFSGMAYTLVKLLFNPLIGLSYPKIINNFCDCYLKLTELNNPKKAGEAACSPRAPNISFEEMLQEFLLAAIYETPCLLGKRTKDQHNSFYQTHVLENKKIPYKPDESPISFPGKGPETITLGRYKLEYTKKYFRTIMTALFDHPRTNRLISTDVRSNAIRLYEALGILEG